MKKSKLLNVLRKTSDYLFGFGNSEIYNRFDYFAREFREGDLRKRYLLKDKVMKYGTIITKNIINIFELGVIYSSVKENNHNFVMPIIALEVFRNVLNSFKKDEHVWLNRLKSLESQEHQTLDEIMEDYNIKREEKLYGVDGAEEE